MVVFVLLFVFLLFRVLFFLVVFFYNLLHLLFLLLLGVIRRLDQTNESIQNVIILGVVGRIPRGVNR